jgi:hypothetical protein
MLIIKSMREKDFENAGIYHKRPIQIKALQIPTEFKVKTMEGWLKGKKDDYLVRGIKGELYPCDKAIFEETYIVDKYPKTEVKW